MPRIDPLQLINCLQVLLSPNGGILSNQEVQRLVSLMTKFSKKLVSKCVYVLILKNTERTLLDAFMVEGGWQLIQLWMHDAMFNANWALVAELLELLLITPVDVERLKSNNIPKLVKSLSKREDLQGVHELSNQLVQQWLKIVKDETQSAEMACQQNHMQILTSEHGQLTELPAGKIKQEEMGEGGQEDVGLNAIYKVTVKDGKQLISKVDPDVANYVVDSNFEFVEVKNDVEMKEEVKEKDKKRLHDKSRHKSSSGSKSSGSSSSSNSSSTREKERSSSHKDKNRHSSSSKDKDRNRDKDRRDKDRDKDKRRNNGAVKSSSKSSSSKDKEKDKKETKEKQAEKDKDTLAQIQPQSLQKLPKIPKKSTDEKDKNKVSKEDKKEEPKKGTMSIEVRKNNEERPKTVKVYKSKMRSTGLEEEAKPAPPRPVKKPGAVTPPAVLPPLPLKRPSPIRDLSVVPPEKKTKIETPPPAERPGAIKLISAKPKPPVLQESDMFMDALTASATTKKEPKKRKRRASVSKDSASPPPSPSISGNNASTAAPLGLKNITPPKFYQDTLETDEAKQDSAENEVGKENADADKPAMDAKEDEAARSVTPTDAAEEPEEDPVPRNGNALKGVLVYMRRKGPKKTIKWKPDDELVDIQYFELDETERVNVTKTFGDLAKMDVRGEREAMLMSRKLPNEDVMDVQTAWRIPMELDGIRVLAVPGCKSLEKDIQFAREKSVLQALYFSKKMLPDSPTEPDSENYQIKDPITIPIEDVDNPEHDYRNRSWPEPKGSPPPQVIPNNIAPMFPPVQAPFQNFGGAPPAGFPNMPQNMPNFGGPGFVPPNVMGGPDWNNVNVPNMPPMIPPNMGPPEMMNQGPMNPNMYMPTPDNFNPMMNDNGHRFPPPFNQHQQGPGPGPGGPGPGMFPQNNFNNNRGGFGGFRRGGGSGPWLRMNGPPPGGWNNMRGGGGPHRGGGGPHRGGGRVCNNWMKKGFCRNRDNCQFMHPPPN